ncbi:helix-turn-helix domain-containing protein, partial [Saccharothrix sp. MB29]|nr:helix-turn-helix domain-containing protein [Saccharothrix sp. MB29]
CRHHGRPIRQETVAAWIGLSSTRLSRIENGEPVNDLTKLTRWARTLRVPRHLLWFHLPAEVGDDVASGTPVAGGQESAGGALLPNNTST